VGEKQIVLNKPYSPIVSIVTPSFNQGRFLKRTIESVLNQSYPNIEYFVIDGGSTDESVEILQSYGARFYWVSEKDKGQADAINKGFNQSTGEIRAYLNSDDVLFPGAVETVIKYFEKMPDCDLLYGRAEYIDEHDHKTGMYGTAEYSFDMLMRYCCICQPAAFWRTRISRIIGPLDESLGYIMDYDYWLRIAKNKERIVHIPDILAAYRLYLETKTLSARDEIFKEVFKICLKHGGYVDINWFISYWQYLFFEYHNGWLNQNFGWLSKRHIKIAHIHYLLFHIYKLRPKKSLPLCFQMVKKILYP
jgi:glycosyltransferase involved in cell wall biosynthesis